MINIDEFLLPIPYGEKDGSLGEHKTSENLNCGKYLKYEYIYDEIKEYRREDDARLSQGVWQTKPKKASWKEVKKICEQVLKTQTKDLQIAVWLLEALTALHGFSGLNQGIILLHKLCEKFWDNIYPEIDRENKDMTARIAPFYFFAERIPDKILFIPLTAPTDGISRIFSLSDWISIRHNLRVKDPKALGVKDLKKSIISTPNDFMEVIESDVSNVLVNLKKLDDLLADLCGKNSPSFHLMNEFLNDIQQINAKNLSGKKTQMGNIESTKVTEENSPAANDKGVEILDLLDLKSEQLPSSDNSEAPKPTIEAAYRVLGEISDFLETEQPQSPASTLIKIANAIGKKTFQELLEINMQNGATVMSTISELYKILKPQG